MRQQDARVPAEVEEYLVGLNAAAGQLGGSAVGVGGSGARGGARGGAAGARMLKTVVEERAGSCSGGAGEVLDRIAAALPRAREMGRQDDLVRIDVPIGRTGLQHIVVDLVFGPGGNAAVPVRLRAYGKEGLLSRKPTRSVADQAWTACQYETASTAVDGARPGLGDVTAAFAGALTIVLAEIPDPWDTVWFCVESDSLARFTSWAYRQTPGSGARIHPVEAFDTEPFRRHWEAMRQLETPLPWTTLTVTIQRSPDGDATFHSDYGYDPVSLAEQPARAQRWISAHLPAGIPVEDRP
jgi:hypothetical protein